jgi:hypothetical protein
MLISTALLLDSIIRNSVCTPAKLPCRRVEVGYEKKKIIIIIIITPPNRHVVQLEGRKNQNQYINLY